jgi:putative salt-induced outer membrane protein
VSFPERIGVTKARFALPLLPLFAASPASAALPPEVRAMIESAFDSNDAAGIAAVVKAAKATNPGDGPEIDVLVRERQARLDEQAKIRRANASFLETIDGQVEFGASRSSGNSKSLGAYGSLKLTRSSERWQHTLTGRVDYLRTNGDTTTERAAAAYEPRYNINARLFATGIGQYERDPILGYSSRYTAGVGLGYTLVAERNLHIDVSGGPAVRRTNFVEEPTDDTLAGRGSLAVRWKISPTLNFVQDSSIYVEPGGTNASAVTAIDATLIGQLKARLSYDVKYERDAPDRNDPLDTSTRVTLLYNF